MTSTCGVGARLVREPGEVFVTPELIVKVKELIGEELKMWRRGQVMFTYFHFSASQDLTEQCLATRITTAGLRDTDGLAGTASLADPHE